MVKKINNILISSIIIFIFITKMGTSYGTIGKNINKEIFVEMSGNVWGLTEDDISDRKKMVLEELKKQLNYKGNIINNEMKMETTIKVEKVGKKIKLFQKSEEKYTIRIRKYTIIGLW